MRVRSLLLAAHVAATLSAATLSAAIAQELPPAAADPTVIGRVEHVGYGLVGPRGRHYIFGGIAMGDYSDSAGTRRIVTLQGENQITDDKHVYYRELREGHRWAFSRKASSDGAFGVWIQLASPDPAAAKSPWQSFQQARLELPKDATRPLPTGVLSGHSAPSVGCGR